MNHWKIAVIAGLLGVLGMLAAPRARADEWNKKTIVTFSGPVEIPGRVLPAGTYTFQLLDSLSDRNIVQIFDAKDNLVATVIGIADYRVEPRDKTVIKFQERPEGTPEALRAWFYPGDYYGTEFVYPKKRAIELASLNKTNVPAMPDEAGGIVTEPVKTSKEPALANLKKAPITAITPEKKEVAVEKVIQTKPLVAENKTSTKKLPQTASLLPLVELGGLMSLAAGFGLLAIDRRRA